jgi:hypothetical protein
MPNRPHAGAAATWRIHSVPLRTRDGPERSDQVYRRLLDSSPPTPLLLPQAEASPPCAPPSIPALSNRAASVNASSLLFHARGIWIGSDGHCRSWCKRDGQRGAGLSVDGTKAQLSAARRGQAPQPRNARGAAGAGLDGGVPGRGRLAWAVPRAPIGCGPRDRGSSVPRSVRPSADVLPVQGCLRGQGLGHCRTMVSGRRIPRCL